MRAVPFLLLSGVVACSSASTTPPAADAGLDALAAVDDVGAREGGPAPGQPGPVDGALVPVRPDVAIATNPPPGMGVLALDLLAAPPVGLPFPIVVRTADGNPLTAAVAVTVGAGAAQVVRLYRGRGSVSATVAAAGSVRVRASGGGWIGERTVTAVARPIRIVSGELSGAALQWSAAEDIVIEASASVPAGAILTIAAGTRVLGRTAVNLDVAGTLEARGTRENPILFTRHTPGSWGGVQVNAGATATLHHVFFTAAGGDASRFYGHTLSQPVVFTLDGAYTVVGGGLIDNIGKGFSSRGGKVSLTDVVISRCDQGGEHDSTELLIDRSHVLEIPDGDGRIEDDDNDGVHIGVSGSRGPKAGIIRDSVFAMLEDDGIDHAGALLDVQRVWVEAAYHEGITGSSGGRLTIEDSVVVRSGQGVEAAWGQATVEVKHTLIADCTVGLRWGDEYQMASNGTLIASYVAVTGSRLASVRNFWEGGRLSKPDGITASCSFVDSPEWDGRNMNAPGKVTFDPATGCPEARFRMIAGCAAGTVGPRTCR